MDQRIGCLKFDSEVSLTMAQFVEGDVKDGMMEHRGVGERGRLIGGVVIDRKEIGEISTVDVFFWDQGASVERRVSVEFAKIGNVPGTGAKHVTGEINGKGDWGDLLRDGERTDERGDEFGSHGRVS